MPETPRRWSDKIVLLRDVLVVGFVLLLGWKLLNASIQLDLGGFNFSDLLALLLALFAIGLSALFYFKATDASNKFYDNTYKFTKDISEILGRMEAGFGERLRHLDEGYTGLRDTFNRIPADSRHTEQRIEEEEAEAEEIARERQRLLVALAERAHLHDAERQEFFEKLEAKDRELLQVRRELATLRRALVTDDQPNSTVAEESDERIRRRVHRHINSRVLRSLKPAEVLEASDQDVVDRFEEIKEAFAKPFLSDLRRLGYADASARLTPEGIRAIKELAAKHSEAPGGGTAV